MSSTAAPHILAALVASTTAHDAEIALKLFRILEWFPAEDLAPIAMLKDVLEQWAAHPNSELREAAYRCIPLLPDRENIRARMLSIETDVELQNLLEDEL
jgi:hypothetical protein